MIKKKTQEFFSLLLPLQLRGYEERKEQSFMALDVLQAFEQGKTALIEAGTGTGKSLGYLVPAILWAKTHNTPVVISTNTIALQEQLIEKDIPLAMKTLGCFIPFVLAKGMGNYVCLRKLKEQCDEPSLFQNTSLQEVEAWTKSCKAGSKAELPFHPSKELWEQIAAHKDACLPQECPHFSKCFFFQARRETQEAKLVIVNHHLLFADLALRIETDNFSAPALLPAYSHLIVDEAHHLEDIASEHFSEKISKFDLLKALSLLTIEKFARISTLSLHILEAINERKKLLNHVMNDFFEAATTFCTLCSKDLKLRIRTTHTTHPFWIGAFQPLSEKLYSALIDLALLLLQIDAELAKIKNDAPLVHERAKNLRMECSLAQKKLSSIAERIKSFFVVTETKGVYWIEQELKGHTQEVRLIQAKHDVSSIINKHIFEKNASSVLCSATLATKGEFSFVKARLGLDQKGDHLLESIYPSPFHYEKQVLFGAPSDMPELNSAGFFQAFCRAISKLVKTSRGGAFVLFTSYESLTSCYGLLHETLTNLGYHCLKQGDLHRSVLIKKFKETPRSILFGTDSFWEGVDIQGEALRLVIITKLPFAVPSDPIAEARAELITAKGGNAFREYMLPRAAIKFKQAFGRLIRHKSDSGCCICLDTRLLNKGYGKLFLKNLPVCTQVFVPLDELVVKMNDFYKNLR